VSGSINFQNRTPDFPRIFLLFNSSRYFALAVANGKGKKKKQKKKNNNNNNGRYYLLLASSALITACKIISPLKRSIQHYRAGAVRFIFAEEITKAATSALSIKIPSSADNYFSKRVKTAHHVLQEQKNENKLYNTRERRSNVAMFCSAFRN